MTDQKKKTLITGGVAVLAAVVAYAFRLIGKGSFYPTLFSYLRSFCTMRCRTESPQAAYKPM